MVFPVVLGSRELKKDTERCEYGKLATKFLNNIPLCPISNLSIQSIQSIQPNHTIQSIQKKEIKGVI